MSMDTANMVAILLASLLLCAVGVALVVYRRACLRRRGASSSDHGPPPPPPPQVLTEKKAVEAAVIPAVSGLAGAGGKSSECVVCLSGLEEGEDVRVLPRCGHSFHEACIDAWVWTSPTCPSCRAVIFAESPSPAPADEVVEDTVANGGVVASSGAVGEGDTTL
jgi:hypothetical protein